MIFLIFPFLGQKKEAVFAEKPMETMVLLPVCVILALCSLTACGSKKEKGNVAMEDCRLEQFCGI